MLSLNQTKLIKYIQISFLFFNISRQIKKKQLHKSYNKKRNKRFIKKIQLVTSGGEAASSLTLFISDNMFKGSSLRK